MLVKLFPWKLIGNSYGFQQRPKPKLFGNMQNGLSYYLLDRFGNSFNVQNIWEFVGNSRNLDKSLNELKIHTFAK